MFPTRIPTHIGTHRRWPLMLLLILILFPFGWLGDLWPAFSAVLGAVFPDVNAHAIGHTTLFFILGSALLLCFAQLWRHPWRYGLLLLIIGVGQEAFQLAYKQRPLAFDDFRDLITDLGGGLVALLVIRMVRYWYTRKKYA